MTYVIKAYFISDKISAPEFEGSIFYDPESIQIMTFSEYIENQEDFQGYLKDWYCTDLECKEECSAGFEFCRCKKINLIKAIEKYNRDDEILDCFIADSLEKAEELANEFKAATKEYYAQKPNFNIETIQTNEGYFIDRVTSKD